jgi:hypothetical protein
MNDDPLDTTPMDRRPFPESLCHRCGACRTVIAARSVFVRCTALPQKYPRQPVTDCEAFRPIATSPPRAQ